MIATRARWAISIALLQAANAFIVPQASFSRHHRARMSSPEENEDEFAEALFVEDEESLIVADELAASVAAEAQRSAAVEWALKEQEGAGIQPSKKFLVIGGGWGGWGAAKALCESGVNADITLIDALPDPTGVSQLFVLCQKLKLCSCPLILTCHSSYR